MKMIIQISMMLCFLFSVSVFSFEPAEYFHKKCMSCHTVGQGDDIGPDLKGVTKRRSQEWLIKFIKEPYTMIESGDPIANELFVKFKHKKMPDQELEDDEITAILSYIKSGKVKALVSKFRSALDANPFELKRGKDLFSGVVKLKNGGPACMSCHSAGEISLLGGGTLGPDLTNVYTRYSDKGLSKVIKNINFPTMVRVYKKHKLTNDEIFQIKSFLRSEDQKEVVDYGYQKKFFFIGFVGFLLLLGFFDLLWKGRIKKTNRDNI